MRQHHPALRFGKGYRSLLISPSLVFLSFFLFLVCVFFVWSLVLYFLFWNVFCLDLCLFYLFVCMLPCLNVRFTVCLSLCMSVILSACHFVCLPSPSSSPSLCLFSAPASLRLNLLVITCVRFTIIMFSHHYTLMTYTSC